MRKVTQVIKVVICMLCTVLLLADLLPLTVAAENGIDDEVVVSNTIMNSGIPEIQKEAVTLEDFIWPNEEGQYSYTVEGTLEGKKYLLMVIPGVYKSLDGMTRDEIVSNLLYLDQQTANGSSVDFNGFIPAKQENCTVLVSGEDMPVSIAGYLSKDIYSFGLYLQDAEKLISLKDSFEVERGSTWDSLLSNLPQKAFMEIYSDYADTLYCPATIAWRESADFKTTKIGYMFRVIGDVVPDNPEKLGGFSTLFKPVVINVAVVDDVRIPVSIVASKEQIVYSVGSTISDTDIHLKMIFSDGSTQNITGWTTNVEELSTEEVGTQRLKINYVAQDRTLTTELEIYISDQREEVLHQVNFETFGGNYIETIVVRDGEKITSLEEPEKKGFVFNGWFTDRYRRNAFSIETPITSDIKLYAGWSNTDEAVMEGIDVALQKYYFVEGDRLEPEMISVYANYDDGTRVKVENFETNLSSIDQDTIGKKVLEVSCFDGHHVKKSDIEFNILSGNGNEFVTVTFDTGCDITVPSQTFPYGEKVKVPVRDMEKTGSVFAGWYFNGKKWDFEKNTVIKDMVLQAKWLQKYGEEDFFVYTEELPSYTYTGKAIQPSITVMDRNMNLLMNGKDYSIRYSNNTNPSTEDNSASALVTGKGNYTGAFTVKFKILPKSIEESDIVSSYTDVNTYKSSGYKPIPAIKHGSKKLKNGTDYTVQYYMCGDLEEEFQDVPVETEKLTEVGSYKIVVEGKGNYYGTRTFEYRIVNNSLKNLSTAKITVDSQSKKLLYTGSEQHINSRISVKLGNTVLTEGVDYEVIYPENITDIGKKTVTISALPSSEKCYGSKTTSYEITGLAMSKTSIVLNAGTVQYQSAYISDNIKSISVKASKQNKDILQAVMKRPIEVNEICDLIEGRDYQVSYRDNERVGKAKITITGMGFFSGVVTKNFTIKAVEMKDSAVTVELVTDKVAFNKAGAVVKAKVFFKNQVLKEGRDYTMKCSNNKKIGTAKLEVIGKGNFKGTVKQSYTIVAKSVNAKDIKIAVTNPLVKIGAKDSMVYKPKISITDNGVTVSEKEFVVDYSNCVTQVNVNNNALIGYITLKEKKGGNYCGSKIVPYKVLSNSIEGKNYTFEVKSQAYTGSAITFDENNEESVSQITGKVSLGDGTNWTLVLGEDFEIINYKNNLKPGTATITIKGIGDYTGIKKLTFKIQKHTL